jgi:fructoselysine-6-P-deglycase FrlB-like protein
MGVREYIREQPAVICAALVAVSRESISVEIAGGAVLVGSGSSFNALTVGVASVTAARRAALRVVGPQAYLREIAEASVAPVPVIVLSQSGASTTSIEAATAAAASGAPVLVLTCEPESPIAQLALPKCVLPIGGEPIGPKTKGFTATLAGVLAVLSNADERVLPEFPADDFASLVDESEQASSMLCEDLHNLDYLVVSGSGRFFGIALEASLKVAEIAGFPTSGLETEELLHGRLHGLGPSSLVIMIAGDAGELTLATATANAMAQRDVRVLVLNMTDTPSRWDWLQVDSAGYVPMDTLAAIVPFQWLAVHLALARGMVPEAMRYPGLSAALAIKSKVPT